MVQAGRGRGRGTNGFSLSFSLANPVAYEIPFQRSLSRLTDTSISELRAEFH